MDLNIVLREAVAKVCDVAPERVTSETELEDLGIDSLAVAEIIVELEAALDCELPIHLFRELDGVRTVGDVSRELSKALSPS